MAHSHPLLFDSTWLAVDITVVHACDLVLAATTLPTIPYNCQCAKQCAADRIIKLYSSSFLLESFVLSLVGPNSPRCIRATPPPSPSLS